MANAGVSERSSQTANFTCFSRGCATREKEEQFRGPDTIAEKLFPWPAKIILNIDPLRKLFIRKVMPPGIHEYVLARTKVMDAAFCAALDEKFDQIVLLGSGFDSRAVRFADRNRGTKIFDLDVPTTQQAKRDIFRQRNVLVPDEVVFTPIDFDSQYLEDVLRSAGFQFGRKTLFLWEGVTMYLSAQAVEDTLDFIRASAASGSRVVFDYIYASVLRQENQRFGEEGGYEMVSRVGETWCFGLEEGAVEVFLSERGFDCAAHYKPDDLERLYMTRADGSLYGRINGTHCIVQAVVE
ncbi:MAG: SAM-dependent methyltransferase [Anaerolineaceae bacterium]|nr:SAM-dependent methyltransferase [Anaerolineaceae bacterium]